jgi:hypothetical protein
MKALVGAVTAILAMGTLVAVAATPAGAVLVSKTYTVNCSSPIGAQSQAVTGADDAPLSANAGSEFPVVFPGGTSTLPSSALGGVVTIQSFINLSLTYSVGGGGTFDPATVTTSGQTLNNGNPVTGSVTFGAGNTTMTIAQPGPLFPGTLVVPDVTVNVIAPAAPNTVTISLNQLTTTANVGASPPGTPVPVTCNVPPDTLTSTTIVPAGPQTTVNAGGPVTGDVNTPITLNGSFNDPFGTPTSIQWTTDAPTCSFADPTSAVTTITCTTVVTAAATLTVDDGGQTVPTAHDTATVTVVTPNPKPTVSAGGPVSGEVNTDIALNGSVTDSDGDALTSTWTIDNANCTFADPTSPVTTVDCSVTGTFAATLTGNDGVNLPVTDTATVTVNPPPPGLTVHAGPDGVGLTGQPIQLTGRITDPARTFTSMWTSDSPNCSFADPTMVATTITCTAPGVYAATLTGHDGVNPDASATALVAVSTPNVPPTVSAGGNVTGAKNTAIALHGTVTDPDDTPTITWTSDTPTCTFGNVHAADTTITCPNTGTVAATLTAADGVNTPVSDTAIVTVVGNIPPTVSAGPNVQTAVGFPVQLNGTVTDPDGPSLTVQWTTGSPNCTFSAPTSDVTMITCSAGGVVAATLTASDGINTPVSSTALVTVIAPVAPPIVNAGLDGIGTIRHPVALHGAVFDPASTPTITWSNGNPNCSFGNAHSPDTTITCSTPGIFAATLTAADGVNPPVSDTALITFINPACPSGNLCVNIGDAMTYEGGSLYLPITITQPQPVAVTVNVTILDSHNSANTAVNGVGKPATFVSDFKSATLHAVKIAANARVAYLGVLGLNTDGQDGDKQLQAEITGATAATLPTATPVAVGRALGTGIIKDAFGMPPDEILIGSESIVETDQCAACKTIAKFSVVVNDGVHALATTTMKYATLNVAPTTAIPNVDYVPKNPTTLSFTVGTAIQKATSITILGDPTPDATEDLNIVFSAPSTPTLFDQGSVGHIFILDND